MSVPPLLLAGLQLATVLYEAASLTAAADGARRIFLAYIRPYGHTPESTRRESLNGVPLGAGRWTTGRGQPSSPIMPPGGRKPMGLARSEAKQTQQHTHTNNTHRGHSDSDSSVTNRARRSDHRPSISLQPDGTLHSGVLFDLHPSARTEGAHTTYLPNRPVVCSNRRAFAFSGRDSCQREVKRRTNRELQYSPDRHPAPSLPKRTPRARVPDSVLHFHYCCRGTVERREGA